MDFPQWATSERRAYLVELFVKSRGFCIYGHPNCPNLEHHAYEIVSEEIIADWIGQDREERKALWEKEQRELHRLPQIYKRGPFDSIRRWEYLDNRPIYRIKAIGVNPFNHHRTAQVEIPGLRTTIWIDLAGIKCSKSKLRKVIRYQRGAIPKDIEQAVNDRIARVVARHI